MKKSLFFLIAFCFLHLAFGQVQMESLVPIVKYEPSDPRSKLRSSLFLLEQEYLEAIRTGVTPEEFSSSQPLVMIQQGMVRIEAAAQENVQEMIRGLEVLGARQIDQYERVVNAWYPIDRISRLPQVPQLNFVKPVYRVRGDIGSVTSEGDVALEADDARDTYCVNGSGVRVGVLSDSYTTAFPGGAAAGVASGDLPGVGNPNGFTTPVTVVADGNANNIDEGRAMIEIIHDLAPGAQLFFNTANGGQASFANAITTLALPNLLGGSDCDVIVDDIRYFEEPFYQDGLVARACDAVFALGVPYFASAGNYGRSSYEAAFNDSGNNPNIAPNGALGVAHDFDPGAGTDILQSITVNAGSAINITLQWDDPFGSVSTFPISAQTDLDLFLVNGAGNLIVGASTDANVGGDPTEFIGFTDPNASGTVNYNILITRNAGPSPAALKWVIRNANGLVINEYMATTVSGQATGYGHSNATGANAVGAAFWQNTPAYGVDPPQPEGFTSAGGVQIRFNNNGVPITPVIRNKPNFSAVDGVSNTFFGNGNNFFGTSAAAPHAAAVAALMLEANPNLSPTQVRNILAVTVIDMPDPGTPGPDPGFDYLTGTGLIQADAALQGAIEMACNISDIQVLSGPTCEGKTYSVTLRISYNNNPDCEDILEVNGQTFSATGANFQDVTLAGLIPDGNPVSVTAFFQSATKCSRTANNLFTAPNAPVGQNTVENIDCSGDPFSINLQSKITNGVAADFTWSVNYNGLTGGSGSGSGDFINEALMNETGAPASAVYTVSPTGTVEGCEGSSFTVTVTVPPVLTATAEATSDYNGFDVSCHGGSDGVAEAFPEGGTPPFTYEWDDPNGQTTKEATGLMAQTYMVVITDANGCQTSASVTLSEPPPLFIDAGENQTVYFGYPPAACATLSWSGASGGVPPYDISWSTGETMQSIEVCPMVTTLYTVTMVDANGCTFSDEVLVCAIDVRCGKNLDKVEICHVPPGNITGPRTLCVGLPSVAEHLAHGDQLAACGTDHSCPPAVMPESLSAGKQMEQATGLNAYPNPFTDQTVVTFSTQNEGQVKLTLMDATGRVIRTLFQNKVEPGPWYSVEVDATELGAGLHFCLLQHSDGTVLTKKLIRN